MIRCQICKELFKTITNLHLWYKHGITVEEYKKKFDVKHLWCKSERVLKSEEMLGNKIGVGNKNNISGIGGIGVIGHTEEFKKEKSKRNDECWADGTFTVERNCSGRCKMLPVMNYVLNKIVKVQGELELRFAKLLNKMKIRWIIPKYKTYILNGKKHKYFCDFWLPDKRLYVEVKGFIRDEDEEKTKAKKLMMIRKGKLKDFRYKMMFKKHIKKLELRLVS